MQALSSGPNEGRYVDSFPLKIKINSKLAPFLNPLTHTQLNGHSLLCPSQLNQPLCSGFWNQGSVHHRSYQEAGQLQAPQRASLPNSIPTMTDLLTQSEEQHLILNSLL